MSKPAILTRVALARVVTLVDDGRSAAEIANEMGCTLGTLRVRCSQFGISLRRRASTSLEEKKVAEAGAKTVTRCKSDESGRAIKQSRSVDGESSAKALKVFLPRITTEQLRRRGALRGISGSTLASELLVVIARDDLYDAVLDG
jgi:hypothetical protein